MSPKQISLLEQEVMHIVWNSKRCTVSDVQQKLAPRRKLAYTTVATLLQRLYDKGLVGRKRGDKAYIYSPQLTKIAYSKRVAQSFMNTFFESFGDVAIASFAETVDHLPKDKKEYFLKLLRQYDKGK